MAGQAPIGILKDPVSSLTHFAGAIASIFGLVVLVVYSSHDSAKVAGMAIYGSALVALFSASGTYHFFDLGPRGNRLLRRLDHVAIYLLIAGTYMPTMIILLEGAWRISMIAVVGGLALVGIVVKLFWVAAPRSLTVGPYLVLGWVVVVPAHLILPRLSPEAIFWLFGGGVLYSSGALIYVLKRPDPWPGRFGFHEIWHLFVLAAALMHYFFIFQLVDFPRAPF